VEGEQAVIILRQSGQEWTAYSIVRVEIADHLIARVVDYSHCPWVFPAAAALAVEPVSSLAPEA
jgi:hypothetical protein